MTRLHAAIFRRSSGRVLGHMGGQSILLLQTTGRRSGRERATPLQYMPDGERFVVVASGGGSTHPPDWCLNLLANPRGRVRIGTRSFDVRSREAHGEERETLWRRLTECNHYLERAERKAERELPIVLLEPVGRADASTSRA